MGTTLARYQSPILDKLRPAYWLGALHGLNYACVDWTTPIPLREVISFLESELPNYGFRVVESSPNNASFPFQHQIRAYYLTPGLKWLDVIEIDFLESSSRESSFEGGSWPQHQHPSKNTTYARALSVSTSVVPASIPLAPLFAVLLAWLPFFDHGANLRHLSDIEELLASTSTASAPLQRTLVHPGAKLTLLSTSVVTIVFLMTLCLTFLNIFTNPHPVLNIIVTVFCSILTVLTFLTYFNALMVCMQEKNEGSSRTYTTYDMY